MVSLMSKKGAATDIALRDSLFPGAATRMWEHKKTGGFATIPKTMPYIARILDEITIGKPVGSTYFALWTFTWDSDAFVKMGRVRDIAFAAGFTGARGIRTLNDRLVELRRLGMIETAVGPDGNISYVFLPNPHLALMQLRHIGVEKIMPATFNAFLERATQVNAKDVIAAMAIAAAASEPLPASPAVAAAPPAPATITPEEAKALFASMTPEKKS